MITNPLDESNMVMLAWLVLAKLQRLVLVILRGILDEGPKGKIQ
jgi:hypothetical protein